MSFNSKFTLCSPEIVLSKSLSLRYCEQRLVTAATEGQDT